MQTADICGAQIRYAGVPPPPTAPDVDIWLADGRARLVADRRRALLDVADVGRFAAQDGVEVIVEPAADGDPDGVSTVLYGTVAALLLAQRGEFALHASTVAIGPAGLALTGRSGAGKSTTALALEGRGHRLVTDDVSPVRLVPEPGGAEPGTRQPGGAGLRGPVRPLVVPFGRRRHVWPDTASALGLDLTGGRLVDRRFEKLSLPAAAGPAVSLAAVAVLRTEPAAERVGTTRLTELAATSALLGNAYRVGVLFPLWAAELFGWAAELSRRLAVWTVVRPPGGWSVDAVADQVEAMGVDLPPRSVVAAT